ncbi:MAG: TetR/AcrR family transcriptional regulator [Nitriliruptor sp.]|uniref:TetR/AcrR family transcriptional regulator n=1 Tax=Nitriliruptor sp. TaxID=2448056 RepID=UPI0034A05C30
MTGARLSRTARREQLVVLGHELIADSSFDAVSVDDVASAAGISRGLLFHYFPTKRDFQVAVAERAGDELLAATATDATATPLEQLRAGVEQLIDHVAPRRDAYISLVRGAASGEPELRAVGDRTRAVLADRVVEGLGLREVPPEVEIVVRGWVVSTEEVIVSWLVDRDLDRARLVDVIVDTLLLPIASRLDPAEVERLGRSAAD